MDFQIFRPAEVVGNLCPIGYISIVPKIEEPGLVSPDGIFAVGHKFRSIPPHSSEVDFSDLWECEPIYSFFVWQRFSWAKWHLRSCQLLSE